MIYPIVIYGHPILRKIAVDIDKNYPGLEKLIKDMFETMYNSNGLGLAAPQVGKSVRLFIIDGEPLADDQPELANFKKVFLNAHINIRSGERESKSEACLSIPNLNEEVYREPEIQISYYDENWQFHDEVFDGFKARIIQHEYDHIDGILFTDRVNPLKKRLLKGKLTAISKGEFEADYKTILATQKIKST
jgi:peptide deformylase